MIKPTIGRVVLVYRKDGTSEQFEPALITFVHSDEIINVAGFTKEGFPFRYNMIKLEQAPIADDPDATKVGDGPYGHQTFACWMPYQRRQAEGFAPDSPCKA